MALSDPSILSSIGSDGSNKSDNTPPTGTDGANAIDLRQLPKAANGSAYDPQRQQEAA